MSTPAIDESGKVSKMVAKRKDEAGAVTVSQPASESAAIFGLSKKRSSSLNQVIVRSPC